MSSITQGSNLDFKKRTKLQNVLLDEISGTPAENELGFIIDNGKPRLAFTSDILEGPNGLVQKNDKFIDPIPFVSTTGTSISLNLDDFSYFDLTTTDDFELNFAGGEQYQTYNLFITQGPGAPHNVIITDPDIKILGDPLLQLGTTPGHIDKLRVVYYSPNDILLILEGSGLGGTPDNFQTKISPADTNSGFLENKIVPGSNVTINKLNPGLNEQLEIGISMPSTGFFEYTQSIPSSNWVINHNLNRSVNPSIYNSAGIQVEGSVREIDSNTIIIEFNSSFTGKAIVN